MPLRCLGSSLLLCQRRPLHFLGHAITEAQCHALCLAANANVAHNLAALALLYTQVCNGILACDIRSCDRCAQQQVSNQAERAGGGGGQSEKRPALTYQRCCVHTGWQPKSHTLQPVLPVVSARQCWLCEPHGQGTHAAHWNEWKEGGGERGRECSQNEPKAVRKM